MIALLIVLHSSLFAAEPLLGEKMISSAEQNAVKQLKRLIEKNKGKKREAELKLRLAELYVKRSKTQRFFEFQQVKLKSSETSIAFLKKALQEYIDIEQRFRNFEKYDHVLFNSAFVMQKLGRLHGARKRYQKISKKYKNSIFFYDSQLALAEIFYDGQKFKQAINHYRVVEKNKELSISPYATYKSAWSYYNLQNARVGISKLEDILRTTKSKFHLRQEALRDLVLFFDEVYSPQEAYQYFKSITTADELTNTLILLAKLYDAHDKQAKIPIFLTPFLQEHRDSKHWATIQNKLILTLEKLGRHNDVAHQLNAMKKLCQFRPCRKQVANTSKILIEKRKKATFSKIKPLFESYFLSADHNSVSSNMRFIYAELLVKNKEPIAAISHYILAHEHSTADSREREKLLFSSMVSMNLANKAQAGTIPLSEIRLHVDRLDRLYGDSENVSQLRYQLGLNLYKNRQHQQALQQLRKVTSGEFQRASQDLVLDTLNALKDFSGLIKEIADLEGRTTDTSRLRELKSLRQQAQYMMATSGESTQKIDNLYQFAKSNRESELGVESFIEAIKLAKKSGDTHTVSRLTTEFAEIFSRSKHAKKHFVVVLKQAVSSLENTGNIAGAAKYLHMLYQKTGQVDFAIMSADYYFIQKREGKAQEILNSTLPSANPVQRAKIYSTLNKIQGHSNNEKYDAQILKLNIEPYKSEILLKRAKTNFKEKKYAAAFALCRKVIAQKTIYKAEARLLQAKILADEYFRQSLNSRAERFELVVSLKLEKFDKVNRALISTIKMAKIQIQTEALALLNSIQLDLKNSLTNIKKPTGMPDNEFSSAKEQFQQFLATLQPQTSPEAEKFVNFTQISPSSQIIRLDGKSGGEI